MVLSNAKNWRNFVKLARIEDNAMMRVELDVFCNECHHFTRQAHRQNDRQTHRHSYIPPRAYTNTEIFCLLSTIHSMIIFSYTETALSGSTSYMRPLIFP